MPPATEPPPAIVRMVDVPYVADAWHGADANSSQTLDLYVPAGDGPFPLILWIHGGGWHSFGKQPEGEQLALQFIPQGFALAAINYRLTPDAPFPAQIEDCQLALRWLRQHASEHHLDPSRVGALGHSAGGHLAALMATGGIVKSAEPVQAAVCWSPPCDLDRERGEWPRNTFVWNPDDKFTRTFFRSGGYDTEFAREASPTTHAHAGMPPILLVHGAEDNVVPPGQTLAFARRLASLNVDFTLRIVPEANHGLMNPTTEREALVFFKRTLRPR